MNRSESPKAEPPSADALPFELPERLVFRPCRAYLVPQLAACAGLMLGGLVLPLLGLSGVGNGIDSTERLYLQGGIPLMLVMLWLGFHSAYGILHQELHLDAKGIVWKTRRLTLSSHWSNVAGIAQIPLPRGSILGLALKQSGLLQRRNPIWPPHFPDAGIPLQIFGNPWHGKLHQALLLYAPALFEPTAD